MQYNGKTRFPTLIQSIPSNSLNSCCEAVFSQIKTFHAVGKHLKTKRAQPDRASGSHWEWPDSLPYLLKNKQWRLLRVILRKAQLPSRGRESQFAKKTLRQDKTPKQTSGAAWKWLRPAKLPERGWDQLSLVKKDSVHQLSWVNNLQCPHCTHILWAVSN